MVLTLNIWTERPEQTVDSDMLSNGPYFSYFFSLLFLPTLFVRVPGVFTFKPKSQNKQVSHVSNEYPQQMFLEKLWKLSQNYLKFSSFTLFLLKLDMLCLCKQCRSRLLISKEANWSGFGLLVIM